MRNVLSALSKGRHSSAGSGQRANRTQPATRASVSRRPVQIKAIAAAAAIGALLLGSVALPAQAATPKMTTQISAVTTTVSSGAQLAYRVTYECSNLTVDNCVAPTFTMPRPQGVDINAQPVLASGNPIFQGNADVASSGGTDPLTFVLNDLKPGTTGEVNISWTVPSYTTLPGTIFPGTIDLTYVDGSNPTGTPLSTSASIPVPITTTAAAALTVSKQTIVPANSSLVLADEPVTYKIYACNPTSPQLGALDYRDLTIVDTLPTGTQFVSATGGGVYDAGSETITWPTNPAPSRNTCATPTEFYEATVIYPGATFVPAPQDPQLTNQIFNRVHATAVGIDGTPLEADGSQEHNFIGPPVSPTGDSFLRYKGAVTNGPSISNTNTTSKNKTWQILSAWYTGAGSPDDPSRIRPSVMIDRIPCVVGGTAVSPAMPSSDPLETSYPGVWSIPADQCTNPAYNVQTISSSDYRVSPQQIELVTWDGTTSRMHTWTRPAGAALTSQRIFNVHQTSTSVVGNIALGIPDSEIVTDIRIVTHTYIGYTPPLAASASMMSISGTSTQDFADSGALAQTNTYRPFYGNEFAAGATPPVGVANMALPISAQHTYFAATVDPQVTKTAVGAVNALKPGGTASWRVTLSNGPNATVPMRPKLVDVLPLGLEYIDGSAVWSNVGGIGEPTLTQSTMVINGQDRTILTWNWPAGTALSTGDPSPTVRFDTRVTLAAASGPHSADDAQIAVLFDEDSTITTPTGPGVPTDKWDLNGNGNTTEVVGQASVGWTVVASSGATIEKQVRGALDADWTTNGLTNATYDGSDSQVDYRLLITNSNTLPLADLVVYDVLPYVGDTAIGQSLAGEDRGTEWRPLFDSMTSLPVGATVEYSTSANPCRPELFGGTAGQVNPSGCDDNWTATIPADATTVRALKINLASVAPSDTPTLVEFRMQAPKLTGLTDLAFTDPAAVANNNVAWHTFRVEAAGAPVSLPAAEAPLVSVRRAAGQIGDRVWQDTDRNGLQDSGEPGIAGITVNLLDASGSPVLDTDGNAITTTTDANGFYSFAVPLGEWSVSFTDIPGQYDLTTPGVGTDESINSSATGIGVPTRTVTITDPVTNGAGSNVNLNLDAGLVFAGINIVKDDNRNVAQPGEELTYDLTVTNSSTRAESTGVVVTDVLPAELDFVSATDGGTYDAATNTVTWNLGTFAALETRTIQVIAAIKTSTPPGTQIENAARVTTDQGCDDPVGCETTDITRTPDISIVKDDHKTVVLPGEESTYDLTVTNKADVAAADVVVTDVLPANLTFVSATDGGTYDAATRTVTWNLGSLDAGAQRIVQIVATVSATAVINDSIVNPARVTTEDVCVDDPATPQNECESIDINHIPSVSITKDDGREIVRPGETLNYVLTATNNSDVDAPNVIVRDTLPSNVDFVSSSIRGVQAVDDESTFEWELGTLAAGESKQIIVTVKVHLGLPAETLIVNTASITTDGRCVNNPATEVNECEATDIDRTPSDVWILKDNNQNVVTPGQETTYDITVGNNSSTQTVTDAIVTDKLPENATFVAASDGGKLSADGSTVTWTVAELLPGATVTVTVTVKASVSLKPGDRVINTAILDIPGGCNTDEVCTTTDIDAVPHLVIVKDDNKETVKPGDSSTYDVTVTNKSDAAAEDVVVTDTLPDNVTYVSSSDNGSYDAQARTVTWSLGDIAVGGVKTVKVSVTVNAGASGSVVNNATVTTKQGCLSDTDCVAQDITKISGTPLALTGADTQAWIAAGGLLALLGASLVIARRKRKTIA